MKKSLLFKTNTGVNSLRPRQNGRRFADDTFKRIFLNENVRILIKIPMKFVPKGPINNYPALVQIMAWCRSGDKPLSEPMMVSLLTHICVTRPQWNNKKQLPDIIMMWYEVTKFGHSYCVKNLWNATRFCCMLIWVFITALFFKSFSLPKLHIFSSQWCHNVWDGISNHCLFRRRSKKTSKRRTTGLCGGNSPVTGEFPTQKDILCNSVHCTRLHTPW